MGQLFARPINFFRSAGVAGLQPEIFDRLRDMEAVFRVYAPTAKFVITAAQEWDPKHGLFSLHHAGYAVDLQTLHLRFGADGSTAELIAAEIQAKLGKDYLVGLHTHDRAKLERRCTARGVPYWPGDPHIHVQYQQGVRAAPPGDYPQRV